MITAGWVLLGMALIVAVAIGNEERACGPDCACFPDEGPCMVEAHEGRPCRTLDDEVS